MHSAAVSLALLLALGWVAGCGDDAGEGGEAGSFVGIPWLVSSLALHRADGTYVASYARSTR